MKKAALKRLHFEWQGYRTMHGFSQAKNFNSVFIKTILQPQNTPLQNFDNY